LSFDFIKDVATNTAFLPRKNLASSLSWDMPRFSHLTYLIPFAILVAVTSSPFAAPQVHGVNAVPMPLPFAKPWLTATAGELQTEAKRIMKLDARYAEGEVAVLLSENLLTYDAQGRQTHRERLIIRINTQAGVESYGGLSVGYSPYYQNKASIRARVIGTDASVASLDQSLVVEKPEVTEASNVFSDRKRLDAPLPRLAVGSIIEEEFVTVDRVPMLNAGVTHAWSVGFQGATYLERFECSAPTSRPLSILPVGFSVNPRPMKANRGNTTVYTYEFAPSFGGPSYQNYAPSDQAQWPTLHVSTAASWAAVAADYRSLVEPVISDSGFTSPPELRATTQRQTLNNLVKWLHTRVRYTGIEFGVSAIVPWKPTETISRGFGDCKDKAAVLVAALRANGIRADLAVLLTGGGIDVLATSPGMGRFDHAIVRATIDGQETWIDATESMVPAGQLPLRDQGRNALVLAADTKVLQRTPVDPASKNTIREVRRYVATNNGGAAVTETTTETGAMFANMRSWVANTKREDVNKALVTYAKSEYLGTFVRFVGDNATDVDKPFQMVVEAVDSRRVQGNRDVIDVYLFPSDALGQLPDAIASADEDNAQRTFDFVWWMPHRYEIVNQIVIPDGFLPPKVSPSSVTELGTMKVSTTRRIEGSVLTVTYTLDSSKARMTRRSCRRRARPCWR
jgi:hypothetical protein